MPPMIFVQNHWNTSLPDLQYNATEYLRSATVDTSLTSPGLSSDFRTGHRPSAGMQPLSAGRLQPRLRRSIIVPCQFALNMIVQNPGPPEPGCLFDCVPTVSHNVHNHHH